MLDADTQLTAEAATDARHYDANERGWQLQNIGQGRLHLERQLPIGPDREHARAVPGGRRCARLGVASVLQGRGESVFVNAITARKGSIDVAVVHARAP